MGKLKKCQGLSMQTGMIYPKYNKGRNKTTCGRYIASMDTCSFYHHPCYSAGKCEKYITIEEYEAKMRKRKKAFYKI